MFFFESVGVPGGSPELRKGNSGWVPSLGIGVSHWLSYFPLLPSLSRSRPRNGLFFALIPFLSKLKLKLDVWPMSCHVSTLARVRFWPKATHPVSVQVQIISHELNASHFSTFKIFVNNLVPGSHSTHITSKNVKNRLSRNSMKFV